MPDPITDPAELRHATLDAIRANPEHWDQSAWRCDTGMCFAGWAAQLAGGVFPYDDNDDRTDIVYGGEEPRAGIVTSPTGQLETISVFAQDRLGLTDDEADILFYGDNDLYDLTELVRRLDAGESILDYLENRFDEDGDDYAEGSGSL